MIKPLSPPSILGIAIATALASTALHANELQLPSTVVVGGTFEDVTAQPGSVTIVNEEELELIQPLSTEDVLRRIPGIAVKGEEESAVVVNFGVRGLPADSSKTLVLEDGVPVAPSLFLGNARYYNPRIQRMQGIEVLKGAASLRYGPSTIGGVINYQTKDPKDGFSLSTRTGSHGLKEASLEAGGSSRSGDATFGIFYTKAESDGFMGKGYELDDFMAKAGVAIGDNQRASIKFSKTKNDANISYRGLFVDDYKRGKKYNPAPDDEYLSDRTALDINHEWYLSDNVMLNTVLFWSEMDREYWRYDVDDAASASAGRWVYKDTVGGRNRTFERYGFDTRLKINHQLFNMDNETEVGFRYLTESMENKRVNGTRQNPRSGTIRSETYEEADSYAFYIQNQFGVNDKLRITPGLRVETYEQSRRNELDRSDSADTQNTEVLPGVGFTYELMPTAQLFGGVYKAFAPAQSSDALNGYDDQKLDAERSTNLELGLRGSTGKLNYELVAFQMDFKNQIVAGNSDPNLLRQNAGKTLHQGIEVSAGYDIGGGFDIGGNLTYIPTSEYRTGEDKGNRIVYSPEVLANLALGYSNGFLRAELSAQHTGSQYGSSDNRKEIGGTGSLGTSGIWGGKLDSYTTLNLNARYEINSNFSVFGAVKNLSDERYITGLRQGIYVGPERSYEAGIRYTY